MTRFVPRGLYLRSPRAREALFLPKSSIRSALARVQGWFRPRKSKAVALPKTDAARLRAARHDFALAAELLAKSAPVSRSNAKHTDPNAEHLLAQYRAQVAATRVACHEIPLPEQIRFPQWVQVAVWKRATALHRRQIGGDSRGVTVAAWIEGMEAEGFGRFLDPRLRRLRLRPDSFYARAQKSNAGPAAQSRSRADTATRTDPPKPHAGALGQETES